MRSWRSHRMAAMVFVAAMALATIGCGSDGNTVSETADNMSEVEDNMSEAEVTDTAETSETGDNASETGDNASETEGGTDSDGEPAGENETDELFPDVLDATATLQSDGTWTFSATLSSPYDTPARYADGWRVVGQDGTVFGTRVLTHDHQSEQPFTRSESGIEIPDDVAVVTVEGRDQISGWGGATVEVTLQR